MRLSHLARASQSHTPAHAAGMLRAGAHAARGIRNGCIGSLPVATAFWPSLRDGGITSYATSLPPSLPSETSVCHQARASPARCSPSLTSLSNVPRGQTIQTSLGVHFSLRGYKLVHPFPLTLKCLARSCFLSPALISSPSLPLDSWLSPEPVIPP